jgi:Immunoglobulin-like domain of bacterial spore germination/Sporulation and spore germination
VTVRRLPRVSALALLVGSAVVLAGCGSHKASSPASTTTVPSTTAPGQAAMALTVYRVAHGVVVPKTVRVSRTPAVASAALAALGLPAHVTIAGGTATVDLPQATADQVAEIVYTLTQFPSVDRVDIAGRSGLTRARLASYAPLILIDAPAADAEVPTAIRVTGSAEVFEATLVVKLVRDGKTLDSQTVTATAGAPQRGTFATTLHAPSPGPATVVAYSPSAEDGSHQHEVDVPVDVTS